MRNPYIECNKRSWTINRQLISIWVVTLICASAINSYGLEPQQEQKAGDATNAASDPASNLAELKAVVDANPEDLAALGSYAQALYRLGNLPAAWEQLSKAYQLSASHGGVQTGIQSVMNAFKIDGLFTVNTPEATIRSVLGEPHHRVQMPQGFRFVYGFLAVDFRDGRVHEIIDLRGAKPTLFQPTEIVECDLDGRGWQVGLREKSAGSSSAHFFLPGESISQWTEMFTIERILDGAQAGTIKRLISVALEQIKNKTPDVQSSTLHEDDSSAIVAVAYSGPDGDAKHRQLVRYMLAPKDVHRLAYSIKGQQRPSEQVVDQWVRILLAAKLSRVGASIPQEPRINADEGQKTKKAIREIASLLRQDLGKASQYRPGEPQLAAIAASADDLARLTDYCQQVYRELRQGVPAANTEQSEVVVFGLDQSELPGGYSAQARHFRPETKFYGFKYVAPGESSGMSYDGLFQIDNRWYFLPKAWRAFRD
jgi:hypothetical protein